MQPRIQALTVRDGRVCAIWDVANPDKFTASPLGKPALGVRRVLIGGPRNPACVTGIEALLGDSECGVHPGAHVLDADLVGQLDHALVAEAAPQVPTCSSVTVCGSVVMASA